MPTFLDLSSGRLADLSSGRLIPQQVVGWPAGAGEHFQDHGAMRGVFEVWEDLPPLFRSGLQIELGCFELLAPRLCERHTLQNVSEGEFVGW